MLSLFISRCLFPSFSSHFISAKQKNRVLHHSYIRQTHWVFVWLCLRKYRDIQSRRISIESLNDCTVSHKRVWSWCLLMKTTYGKKLYIFVSQTRRANCRISLFVSSLARSLWRIPRSHIHNSRQLYSNRIYFKVLFAYFSWEKKRKWSIFAKKYQNAMVLFGPNTTTVRVRAHGYTHIKSIV